MDETLLAVITVARRHMAPEHAASKDMLVDLPAIGIGSLEMVGFICDLEDTLSVRFPADMIDGENFRNLERVAESVRRARKLESTAVE